MTNAAIQNVVDHFEKSGVVNLNKIRLSTPTHYEQPLRGVRGIGQKFSQLMLI